MPADQTNSHSRIWLAVVALLVMTYFACQKSLQPAFKPPPLPYGMPVGQSGITLVPESERALDYFVMGLNPEWETNFRLTDEGKSRGGESAEIAEIDRNLYWLNFEMSHGAIMRFLPENSHLFVAVPWPQKKHGCSGREEAFFKSYLIEKCGWAEERIRRQVHFFCSPTSLVWAQDVGEILGRDAKNRAIIDVGQTGQATRYRRAIQTLAKTFPQHFVLKVLPKGINAEGGDEEIVWTPEGKLALMVGRHRIQAFLENRDQASYDGRPIDDLAIAEAREALSKAFYGLPVHIVPEEVLLHPEKGHPELFHLDMLATVLFNHRDKPHAFVPTYTGEAVDASSESLMSRDFVDRVQSEFDSAAKQLDKLGYQVVRLPFADHPVRSPINLVKYHDREKDRIVVLLPHYSYHLPPNQDNPRQRLQQALDHLDNQAIAWNEQPNEKNFTAYLAAIRNLWRQMEESHQMPNPIFDKQAALFRKAGYEVVGIPSYSWGSGGLHCQMLR